MADVSSSVGQCNVADLEEPSFVRFNGREALVGYHSLSARCEDLGAAFVEILLDERCRCARIAREAPDYCVVLEVLRDAAHESVLADERNDRLVAGCARQVGQISQLLHCNRRRLILVAQRSQ